MRLNVCYYNKIYVEHIFYYVLCFEIFVKLIEGNALKRAHIHTHTLFKLVLFSCMF